MSTSHDSSTVGSALVKRGLADMLRGGVIMDVVNPEQAKIAEDSGAVAVMALERVPSDIRRAGGVACLIRSKGEAGTGNVVEAVRHLRTINAQMRRLQSADANELFALAKDLQAPLPLVQEVSLTGKLPVPLFCAGGISTPADASLVLQLGAEAIFVGSGIFKSDDPERMAKAIVEATTHFRDAHVVAKVSTGLGAAMKGIETASLEQRLAERGW